MIETLDDKNWITDTITNYGDYDRLEQSWVGDHGRDATRVIYRKHVDLNLAMPGISTLAIRRGRSMPEHTLAHRLAWFLSSPTYVKQWNLDTKSCHFLGMSLTADEQNEDLECIVLSLEERTKLAIAMAQR